MKHALKAAIEEFKKLVTGIVMSGAKEIRSKIKSIKSTQKITRAMEMVAASKMRKAQDRMRASRPYAEKNSRSDCAFSNRASGISSSLFRRQEHVTWHWFDCDIDGSRFMWGFKCKFISDTSSKYAAIGTKKIFQLIFVQLAERQKFFFDRMGGNITASMSQFRR